LLNRCRCPVLAHIHRFNHLPATCSCLRRSLQMWVLFRDENGAAACVRDECAHRACPLSLGTVVDGQVQCAYHGWQFNSEGACTKMPSTAFCKVGTMWDGRVRKWAGGGGQVWRRLPILAPAAAHSAASPTCCHTPSLPSFPPAGHRGAGTACDGGGWAGVGVAGLWRGCRCCGTAALPADGAARGLPGGQA